jgi:hypothetical protein
MDALLDHNMQYGIFQENMCVLRPTKYSKRIKTFQVTAILILPVQERT